MKTIRIHHLAVAALVSALAIFTTTARADDLNAKAQTAVDNFKRADAGLATFFTKSAGYAILPSVGEGGFIVGGQHGDGLVYAKGRVVGKVAMTEVSVGAQVGGGTFSEVIFFETEAALQRFTNANWEMSAKAKATVAASGAAANASYEQGVAVFTLPEKGGMLAATVGGQKFKYEAVK